MMRGEETEISTANFQIRDWISRGRRGKRWKVDVGDISWTTERIFKYLSSDFLEIS